MEEDEEQPINAAELSLSDFSVFDQSDMDSMIASEIVNELADSEEDLIPRYHSAFYPDYKYPQTWRKK